MIEVKGKGKAKKVIESKSKYDLFYDDVDIPLLEGEGEQSALAPNSL